VHSIETNMKVLETSGEFRNCIISDFAHSLENLGVDCSEIDLEEVLDELYL